MKSYFWLAAGLIIGMLFTFALATHAATVLFPIGGGTGTSTAPVYGQLLVGNAGGTYTLTATSSLGISGGGSSFAYPFPSNATSTSLTFSGGASIANLLVLSGITGVTNNCLQTNLIGQVSGTGAACGSGTVTSVALTAPTGLTVSGSPITTSGTLGLSLTAGYNIPLTASTTDWNTAYLNRITSLTTTGTGAATLSGNVLNIPTPVGGTVYIASTTPFNIGDLAQVASNGAIKSIATSSLKLAVSSFASPNISQWTNDSGYITGNQSITLSGDISGTGSTAITTSYNNVVPANKGGAGTVSGILKANGSGTVTAAANGTDYSLITALTCGAGQFFNAATASGVFTCGTPAGTTYTGTYPIIVSGSTISTALASSTLTASSPLTGSFAQVGTGGSLGIQVANTSQSGYLTSTDWNTFNGKQAAGNYITALTGDGTASGPGSSALTLATVNSNVGSFTNANVTVNGKGLVTAVSNGTAPTTYTGTYPIIVSGSAISTALASSTLTASSPLTGSFAQVGTGGSLGCQTASGSQAGCLSSTDWTTFNGKQGALTLTTTGTSGAATLVSNTLNIPQYAGAISSVSNSDGTLTISPTTGAVVASIALGHANTWTAAQQFPNVGIGVAPSTASGLFVQNAGTSNGILSNNTSVSNVKGVASQVTGGSGTQYGFYSLVTAAATTNYALYGNAQNATTNWGLYVAAGNSYLGSSYTGIGTTTPLGASLVISSSTGPQLSLTDGSLTSNQWAFRNAGGTLYIGTTSPATYATSTPSAISITSSATTALGVGTSSPWRTLSVVGTVAINGLSAAAGSVEGVCYNTVTSEIQVNTLTNCTVSSERYKHDITYLSPETNGLSAIEQLKPVSFIYNGKSFVEDGFIAEDVASTTHPELAGYDASGTPSAVDDIGIDAQLVLAVQQQQKEIEGMMHDATDDWQWLAIILLAAGLAYQQYQIRKLRA